MGCTQSTPVDTSSLPKASATSKPSQTSNEATTSTTPTPPSPVPANYASHVLPKTAAGGSGQQQQQQQQQQQLSSTAGYSSETSDTSSGGNGNNDAQGAAAASAARPRYDHFASYASGASTPSGVSDDGSEEDHSHHSNHAASTTTTTRRRSSVSSSNNNNNPKTLVHSTSQIGLDEMIEDRREVGDLRQNVVHIEVPFGKPIEEVYDGVHNGPVLGSGISGLVRLVTHKATGLKYAVKVLDLGLVDTTEGLRQLREEIFIMCQLDHPNIVRLEEVYESHSEIYLVQELCLGGELFDRLDEQPDYHYTESECARLVKQMLSAVRYLHSKGIIHRDLKLENFLFSSTATDSELRMIDFGLSKHFRYGEVQHEAVGTPYTVAPEVIRGSYDERCDIWAIGVIAFLLLSGDPPFGGCGGPEPLMTVRSNILRGEYYFEPEDIWANVSSLARDFIRCLLLTDPQKRPTAREAQKHKWLTEWASRSRKSDSDNVLNPNVVKALVNFKEFSDMRKLLCEVLSFTLLPDQIKELRLEFEKMDTDGSGEISLSALKQVLMTNAGAGSLGALTEEEVEDIFNAMRVRKSETRIQWHEFVAAGLSQCQVDDRNLRLAFERLDSDHKGYIELDDIMNLVGSDALQREEAMRCMWTDSIKAVKGQHARITYHDFLLLMKGQTKETPQEEFASSVPSVPTLMKAPPVPLHVVPEVPTEESLSPSRVERTEKVIIVPISDRAIPEPQSPVSPLRMNGSFAHMPSPLVPSPLTQTVQSAPATPAQHKTLIDMEEMESPLSIDEEDEGILSSGPGVPGTSASLTPPVTPVRSAHDYVTPGAGSCRMTMLLPENVESLMVPGLPNKPAPYTRRRSKSVGEEAEREAKEKELNAVADVVRDMMMPESGDIRLKEIDEVVEDESKSALVVNRKLYRAHRQMRLAVLEASKRFEEQQADYARSVILAQREADEGETEAGMGMIQAGLVMRHGLKKQVSSQDIRALLEEKRVEQQAFVEKANRRGGRGRRSRKKTISDMSGMMSSKGQDEMTTIAAQASQPPPLLESKTAAAAIPVSAGGDIPMPRSGSNVSDNLPVPADEGQMREATVPGEFRKTVDPFGKKGKYGSVYR